MERKAYEVIVEEGRFIYKETGEFLHTTSDAKWIFVLSTSKTLYVGKKKKGTEMIAIPSSQSSLAPNVKDTLNLQAILTAQ